MELSQNVRVYPQQEWLLNMILHPPLLFPVSTAFLKFVPIDFNLAEIRSFMIESKSLLWGNFSSSAQDTLLRNSTLSVHTSCVLIPSSLFHNHILLWNWSILQEETDFIIRPVKTRCFPVFFGNCFHHKKIPYWFFETRRST